MNVFRVFATGQARGKVTQEYAGLIYASKKDEDLFELDDFTGRPFRRKWRVPTLCVNMPRLPRPDFFNFSPEFVCNQRVVELAGEPLEMSGELLPVKVEREKGRFFVFNCTNCINALDHKRSKWAAVGAKSKRLVKPAFLPERFGEPTLFKIEEDGATRLYCVERTGDPDDGEFKALVEKHGLTGLRFESIWSDIKGSQRVSQSANCVRLATAAT